MSEDQKLLQEYTKSRSESAFASLVGRHIELVYSTAFRVLNGDAALSQDVAQMVFIDLARKAQRLPADVLLAGWLYQHTWYTAATAVRAERRRKLREQTAMEMKTLDETSEAAWEKLAPFLDEALNQLTASDRDLLVLRFLKQHDLRSVGAALGISDDAAQKRVSRALEKLRLLLSRRGCTLTAASLTAVMAAKTATAIPAGLAVTVASTSVASASQAGVGWSFAKFMGAMKLKTAISASVVCVSLILPLAVHVQARGKLREQMQILQRQAAQASWLEAENQRLLASANSREKPRAESNSSELLSLRGEAAHLQQVLQELAVARTSPPTSREDVLESMRQMYLARVNALKDYLKANPSELPEIDYVGEDRWLEFATYDHRRIDPGNRKGLANLRNAAQYYFAEKVLRPALAKFSKSNNGQFPSDIFELKPFLESPVGDSVLQNWVVLPASSLPPEARIIPDDRVITQRAAVDPDNDQRTVIGLKQADRMPRSSRSQWGVD